MARTPFNSPVDFIHDLSKADSLQAVLDTIAYWISHVFDADRASITLQDIGPVLPCKILKNISSCIRSQAIMRFPWILKFRLGRLLSDEFFAQSQLIICDDLAQSDELDCKMLSEHGMGTCMDAPMIHNGVCIGTLNVADQRKHHYTLQQAILLQSLATWLALNIKLHLQVQEMAVLASTDELTGTFNRRVFVQESNQTMQHFSHARVPFTIGILDIDHFKQLNDCYGHTAGDHVLKKMTKKIKGILREGDFLARIGGEEFAIILPACLGDEAMRVFKRADKALYCAKQAGRNRIHFAN